VIDPDPRVAGQGVARMRSHGIEVAESGLAREARWLALGHELRITAGRPFIQLKYALDAEGMIPAGDGAPVWATGIEARARGHLLRAEADAILVGHGTATADDPDLTCRLPGLEHRSPVRVVLSGKAELPVSAKMLRNLELAPVWVIHGPSAPRGNRERLAAAGAECIETETGADGRLDISAVAALLAQRGITRLLVEGGPKIAESFLKAQLADELVLFQSEKRLTSPAIQPSGLELLTGTSDFTLHEQRPIGADRMTIHRRAHYWQS
jgi:diaminohydroxyphosphoribosylaminopyrimidine deaminase / 5-amino-6-(5-phosphoribosylamino)uracil reductase